MNNKNLYLRGFHAPPFFVKSSSKPAAFADRFFCRFLGSIAGFVGEMGGGGTCFVENLSFLKHGQIYQPMLKEKAGSGSRAHSRRSSASMSLQPVILWRVALQQGPASASPTSFRMR
jgi:hypothetical protein